MHRFSQRGLCSSDPAALGGRTPGSVVLEELTPERVVRHGLWSLPSGVSYPVRMIREPGFGGTVAGQETNRRRSGVSNRGCGAVRDTGRRGGAGRSAQRVRERPGAHPVREDGAAGCRAGPTSVDGHHQPLAGFGTRTVQSATALSDDGSVEGPAKREVL